jgi:3-oxoacyl-[acyl-carrier protein] reductase
MGEPSTTTIRPQRFADRVCVVTGAARGLGFAIADRLGSEGGIVFVNDVDETAATAAATTLVGAGRRAYPTAFDVSDSRSVDKAFESIAGRFGTVDVLVNNAGLLRFPPGGRRRHEAWDAARAAGRPWGSLGSTLAIDDDQWRLHVSVLLDGTFFCTRAALRLMEPVGSGAIVNVASMGALQRSPAAPHYAAAKAGVLAFTRAVGLEVAGAGIRVNAVAPGPFDTEIAGKLPAGVPSPMAANIPLARLGHPAELASVVAFLASDEASFCIGEIFTVSGGV